MPKAIAEQLAGRLPCYAFRHSGLYRHKLFRPVASEGWKDPQNNRARHARVARPLDTKGRS
jgi:hypothetical protein